jgi:hypothetical protein
MTAVADHAGPAPYDPARPLALMHIPKTSGTALTGGLAGAVQPRRVVGGFDRCLFGAFDRFDTIHPDIRRGIYASPTEVPRDGDFIAGHLAFSTLSASYPGAQLVTFLREPRARLLSHWVYWRTQEPDHTSLWGEWENLVLAGRDSLETFLDRPDVAAQTDNLSLRMLLWPHPKLPDADFIAERDDEVLLGEAFIRLRHLAYADVIENPRLVENLSAWCGGPVVYPPVNETPNVPPALRVPFYRELSPLAFDRLHARTRLDLWLWTALAERRVQGVDISRLCEHAFARAVARCAGLLAG